MGNFYIFNYQINKNTMDIFLNDSNKTFKVLLEFKPFYLVSNLNYKTFRIRDLFNNPFFMEILKSQILNNMELHPAFVCLSYKSPFGTHSILSIQIQ